MKGALLFAAGVLLDSASAGVHKMKLQKIPLSDQLVSAFRLFRLISAALSLERPALDRAESA